MGFWFTLLLWGAATALGELMARKPEIEDAKPPGLGDFKLPTATEGRPVPKVWGTVSIEGPNVVWRGNLVQEPITEKVKYSMFRSKRIVRGYRSRLGMQFALCKGVVELTRIDVNKKSIYSERGVWFVSVANPGSGYSKGDELTLSGGTSTTPARVRVTKVRAGLVLRVELIEIGNYTVLPGATVSTTTTGNGTGCQISTQSGLVAHEGVIAFDRPTLQGGDDLGNGGISGNLQFFSGTNNQNASSYLSQFQKTPAVTGGTSAYRDIAYLAPSTAPINLGNSTTIQPWRFFVRRCPNPLSLTSNRHIVNGGDANPACVLYEHLVDEEDGFGFSASDVDMPSFVTAANTLHAEGNGFSFLLDRQEDIDEMRRRIEAQIDGIVFRNPGNSNKWTLRLIRNDYNLATVPSIEVGVNVVRVVSFTGQTWEQTKNQVRTPFNDREDDFKSSYGFAQDMAGIIRAGRVASTSVTHPGVKSRSLANALAWREIRTLAYPLAVCEIVVDRTLYGLLPGDVVKLTSQPLGITDLPMRVRNPNYGDLLDGEITLNLTQDIFSAGPGIFADPPPTSSEPPSFDLDAFATDDQVAFEAPRALVARDPGSSVTTTDKVFAAARAVDGAAYFRIVERHAAGTPSGPYTDIGEVYGFMLAGELASSLAAGSAYPLASLIVEPDPDSQAAIIEEFQFFSGGAEELGTELSTLCLIDNEFILVSSVQASGANIQLNDVYRGVLDSVQSDHAAGARVYMLFVGAGLSDGLVVAGDNVDVKLLPASALDQVQEVDATAISFAMANRTRRPYPPAEASLNGVRFDTTVSLEGGSGTNENEGIDFAIVRRDFRTLDEVASLLSDAAVLDATYPSENSTTHEVEVINDPSGTPVSLLTQSIGSGTSGTVTRIDILLASGGALPTSLRFAFRSTHTFEGSQYDSLYDLNLDFSLSSALTGQFEFGALDTNVASAAFTVANDAVNHDFTISSAFSAGDVEYRLNGGSWTTLIAAGNTSGTVSSGLLTNGDTIEVRHGSSDTGAKKFLAMSVSTPQAFAILYV